MKVNLNEEVLSTSRRRRKGRGGKASNGRSAMLKMIMPELSGSKGDALIRAVETHNAESARSVLKSIADSVASKLADSSRKQARRTKRKEFIEKHSK